VRPWLLATFALVCLIGFLEAMVRIPAVEQDPRGYLIVTVNDQLYLQRFCGTTDEPNMIGCARFNEEALPDPWCVIMVLNHPRHYTRGEVLDHERKHCTDGKFHATVYREVPTH
jgi:hypothetical protein